MEITPSAKRPGAKLRAARIASGLTVADLAIRLKVSPQRVSNLESGQREPSLEMVHRIATAIGCDPHSLDARLASTFPMSF